MQVGTRKIVVLGTGGTIAGQGEDVGYVAGQVAVADLLGGVRPPEGFEVHAEQVAQIDSKDMTFDVWRRLHERCAHWIAQADVAGIVVTHGTDTMEETAYFLHRTLDARKPVVLTGAMRPATSSEADGPRNLADALAAAAKLPRGVWVAFAGTLHSPVDVYKAHSHDLDAFRSAPTGSPATDVEPLPKGEWPRVEIVMNYAGASGALVDALVQQGVRGIVAAGTGNGTLHHELEAALLRAQAKGVKVVRTSRCAQGGVIGHAGDTLPHAGQLSPVKARVALMLELMR
ncbi:asparaginase [Ramlibacter albus]|uniref:Asparaginase n=1 Tax=Ramlibacter albus TaxID=2079448 RepID=A0A923S1T2_9BURK|nr:asparaginase [Ramlibacter albus]MBC5764630.1 asparaginase [Ramlibacter albus]